jgi:hypothetical protein
MRLQDIVSEGLKVSPHDKPNVDPFVRALKAASWSCCPPEREQSALQEEDRKGIRQPANHAAARKQHNDKLHRGPRQVIKGDFELRTSGLPKQFSFSTLEDLRSFEIRSWIDNRLVGRFDREQLSRYLESEARA